MIGYAGILGSLLPTIMRWVCGWMLPWEGTQLFFPNAGTACTALQAFWSKGKEEKGEGRQGVLLFTSPVSFGVFVIVFPEFLNDCSPAHGNI